MEADVPQNRSRRTSEIVNIDLKGTINGAQTSASLSCEFTRHALFRRWSVDVWMEYPSRSGSCGVLKTQNKFDKKLKPSSYLISFFHRFDIIFSNFFASRKYNKSAAEIWAIMSVSLRKINRLEFLINT